MALLEEDACRISFQDDYRSSILAMAINAVSLFNLQYFIVKAHLIGPIRVANALSYFSEALGDLH